MHSIPDNAEIMDRFQRDYVIVKKGYIKCRGNFTMYRFLIAGHNLQCQIASSIQILNLQNRFFYRQNRKAHTIQDCYMWSNFLKLKHRQW